MEIADYILNPKHAEAEEIFNAKFNSVEDVETLMTKIYQEKCKFNWARNKYSIALNNIKVSRSLMVIKNDSEQAKKVLETANSIIDSLYEEYGTEPFAPLLKEFEEDNDSLEADDGWAHWSYIERYDGF